MKRILCATAVLALLAVPSAHAGDRELLGGAGGAAAGAATGAVVGGPVGAAVGGVAGAIIGSRTVVPREARTYVIEHPVDSVDVEGQLRAGYAIPDQVELYPIPDQPGYGYVYVNDRPVIVREHTRAVVYAGPVEAAPGEPIDATDIGVPPQPVIAYVEQHEMQPLAVEGSVAVGAELPPDVQVVAIPDEPQYAYVYTERGPVIVQRHTRRVVWVR